MKTEIDYQKKVWGESQVRLSPTYLAFLSLKYILEDLRGVEGKILDAGCGGGGFAKAIKYYRPDLEVYGVDFSKKAIRKAKENAEGVKFKVGSLYHLPYRDNFFEAVITTEVLEHLKYPQSALDEIRRVLKKEGIFCIAVPLEGSLVSLHFWLSKFGWNLKEKLAGHIQRYSAGQLATMLNRAGFEIVGKRYSTHFLGQLVDAGFFIFIELMGIRPQTGLEENLGGRPILRVFKNMITVLTNLESIIFSILPGARIHLKTARR